METNKYLEFFFDLHATASRVNKQADRNLSTIHGVGITEFMVMRQLSLAANNTLSRIELANAIGLSASGVTRLLNPMEKIGLVQKETNARDARVSLVKLSTTGNEIYNDALVSCKSYVDSMTADINQNQIIAASALLKKLR